MGYALTLTAFRAGQAICWAGALAGMLLMALALSGIGVVSFHYAGGSTMGMIMGLSSFYLAIFAIVGAVQSTNVIEEWQPPRRPRRRRHRSRCA